MDGFEIIEADLEAFTEREAERRFRDLLWAEAARTGIVQAQIHAPSAIHVPDGGLDAIVEDVDPSSEDIIPAGTSGFQIKSSDVANCRNEVTTGEGELHRRIANVLDDGGTYVLVIFEQLAYANEDMGQNKLKERKEGMEAVFADFDYPDANVRVYDSNKLVGFFNRFPGLVARIRGIGQAVDYTTWGREITSEIETFVSDDARDRRSNTIRERLRVSDDGCPTIRVTGPSGVGKTRLLYEVLSHKDLQNRVIFARADRFKNSDLADLLRLSENWHAIVVLEDCDPQDHEDFAEVFRPYERLVLITTSDNPKRVTADEQIDLQPLSVEDISEVLENEFPEALEIRRIARFSEGFPGIAELLVKNVSSESREDENLLYMDEAPLERVIGTREYDAEELRRHKRVLGAFALFERVGWRTADDALHEEAKLLATIAGFRGQDGMAQFTEVVVEQQERGILRGDHYLSVSPLPVATHLMQSWLDKQGTDQLTEIFESLPSGPSSDLGEGDMRSRFGNRIPYMTSSRVGRSWISEQLTPGGLFYQDDGTVFDTEWGSQLFLRLAEASPIEAIRPVEEFIEARSAEELREFRTGRRNVVRALVQMSVWEETFNRAARILLALAEAENEHWANNASGVFAGLFSPAPGEVAPTEVSPLDRVHLIEEALESSATRRQELGVNAATSALKTGHFVRDVGREYQGARPSPNLWHPDSLDDFVDYYRTVWSLLMKRVEEVDDEVRESVVDALVENVRGLTNVSVELSELIRDSLEQLLDAETVDDRKVLRAAVNLLHYESDTLEELNGQLEEWETFLSRASDGTYERRIQRYVGLSLPADNEEYEEQLEDLAEYGLSIPEQFTAQVPWLVTGDPNLARVYDFGYKIGEKDGSNSYLQDILDAFKDEGEERHVNFLSGYLSALQERDAAARRDVLDRIQEDDVLRPYLVDIARLSGMTTHDAERIADEIRDERISPVSLRGLETGGASREIDEPVFQNLCNLLLDKGTRAAGVVLPMFFHYYVYPDDAPGLPHDVTVDLLTHPAFVAEREEPPMGQGPSHYWKDIAEAFLVQYPDEFDRVTEIALEVIGNRKTIVGSSYEIKELLHQLLTEHTADTWAVISSVLEEYDARIVTLSHWLRGDDAYSGGVPVTDVPIDLLWEWVEEDVEHNGPLAARIVPAELFHSDTEVCLAREVLARYGDQEAVRSVLSANFGTEFYTGLSSDHYTNKKERLEEFKEAEADAQVIRWADDEIQQLKAQINASSEFEERVGIDER